MLWIVRRLIFPLLIVSVLLCGALPVLGKRVYIDDPAWTAFGFNACALPCWAGITPGQTRFDRAFDLLVRHVPSLDTRLLISGSQINFSATSPEQYANGLLFYDQGNVGNIRLNVELSLVQLTEHLGTPHCAIYSVGPYAVPGSLTVYWQSNDTLIAALIANAAEVSPTTAVNAVSLSINETACDLESTTPWLGFAPRWRYARAGEVN